MKATIYTRVSTDKQEEGASLDSQLKACLDKAGELGYQVPDGFILSETYSGLTLERTKLSQVRQWARDKEIKAVIAYSLDRVSRDPVHFIILQEELERAGVELILVTETLDSSDMGKLIGYIKGYSAKLEAERIKERTSRGRKARIASGKLAHGKASHLFGYTYKPGRGEGEGIRVINPEKAKIVRRIFDWFTAEYLPLDRIVYRLRDLDIPSPTGLFMWARATIYKMLTNPIYCGGNATPAIIEQETFERAQARLKRNRELAKRNVKRDYLLRGYVYCQHCSRRYQGAYKTDQLKDGIKEYRYYRCSSVFKINANHCSNRTWRAQELDNIVWQEIETALSNPRVILAGLESIQNEAKQDTLLEQELAQVNDRLKMLVKEQEQLLQWALKGFPEETVIKENDRLNQDRVRLNQRKLELGTRIKQVRESQLKIEDIQKACRIVSHNLGRLSFEAKRLALEALSIRVWLDNDNVIIEGNIPINDGALCLPHQTEMGSGCRLFLPAS